MQALALDDSGGPLGCGIIGHIPDSFQDESFKPN